ncbi:SDR family NAD(P)-dependent oxidoreductase [Aspergillus chevalieri]|uniref:Putative secondary metabolism biosynthetic enzyme n=1 Tax=Aspergillus chevalieri TaxID=182096 RepID=A0A7R7ZS14_ASPCH|nr:putative secondary metabolism biosynthetic enzyme [Aspergillus chevalieri]BCR91311.1 putative secondary metabolism biosynthetic enzyme [Aspergillus chevalieri]
MPPPRGTPNILEGPGDYDVTSIVHNDTYPAIYPTKTNFSGKSVFASGASKGLGRAMILSFAKAGASFIAAGARSDMSQLAKDVEAAALSANRPTPTFLPVKMDVTDRKSVEDAAAEVEKAFGKLDIVINNAGILGKFGLITDSNPDEWWQVLDVNIRGPYLVSRSFLPLLLKGEDKYLINVASVAAHLLNPTLSAYQVSKMGLVKLTQLINAEYSGQGVISFAVHPGNSPTDIMGGPEGLTDHEKTIFVETPEISADTLVFLTSQKRTWLGGRYINCTWDMPELMAKEEEIVKEDKLKVKFLF